MKSINGTSAVLSILCFLLIYSNIYSQENDFVIPNPHPINLGIKGGLSVPQLSGGNTEQSQGYKTRLGPNFGVFGNIALTPNFSLQLEAFYASQGGKKTGIQPIDPSSVPLPIPAGVNLYADFSNEAVLNYLEIPLIAKYSFSLSSLFSAYVDAGPYVGFLLNAKTITSGTSSLYVDKNGTPLVIEGFAAIPPQNFDQTTTITSDIKTLNTGITGGFGIARPIMYGEIILDIRGSYGFTNIQKNSINGKNNTGSLVVTLGYSYNIY
ncbi:MAG: porin family protein [Ignavibacteriaceae bacterium]|nr:porin family protein [Ignavibacteriaceae bacterium]